MPDDQILPSELNPEEREDLLALARRLEDERPVPRPAFRGELGRLIRGRHDEPRNVRVLIGAFACSGMALLLVAAVGVAGAGPLAA